jgi:3-phosphoshikimate 1-carboxyvinyltransferase
LAKKSKILISKTGSTLHGDIKIPGSKSISNRALIIRALDNLDTELVNLSSSDDTNYLISALKTPDKTIDIGHAGTCLRFLTSFLCIQETEHILTGSDRIKERPLAPLVDALREIGANIDYLEKDGFAPILIRPISKDRLNNQIRIAGNISSQFVSSLLMIGPKILGGLTIEIEGNLVSPSYVNMTLGIMSEFGINVKQTNSGYYVPQGTYENTSYTIESDWSSASYLLLLSALSNDVDLSLRNFNKKSLQGDARILDILKTYGLVSSFENEKLLIKKTSSLPVPFIEKNFNDHPDLFQGLAVFYAIQGTSCLFNGLETLKIKETDRIKATKDELAKYKVFLNKTPARFSSKTAIDYYTQEGKLSANKIQEISCYNDHRMAMAFAIIASCQPVVIENPSVVSKSYPDFWKDLEKLGFTVSPI